MEITYWSDYSCPYCYIGVTRLKKAVESIPELGDIRIEMKAFRLDPSAGTRSRKDTTVRFALKYGLSREEAEERIGEISRIGREEGLEFNYEKAPFTNTMDAHRLTKFAYEKGGQKTAEKLAEQLYNAYFAENKALADHDVLAEAAENCGLDAEEAREMLGSERYLEEVREDEQLAYRSGINAVPFFVIGKYGVPGAMETSDFRSILLDVMKEETANETV